LHSAGLRILVPLDDAPPSQRALAYAQALASATGGKLKLVRATQVEDETSVNSLARIAERLQDAGDTVEWSVVDGVDGQTAIRHAEATWQPDLIIMATRKASGFDRWLNGSVAEVAVKSARVPVLLVPRDWDRSLVERRPVRILVALDGSRSAERAVDATTVLANRIRADVVLFRAIDTERDRTAANEYLQSVAATMQPMLDRHEVIARVVLGTDAPTDAILNAAVEFDVDAIAMSTRGHGAHHPLRIGATTTSVVDQATVPLLLIGPHALTGVDAAQLTLRADVHSADTRRVGEVHRVVVDLEQHAVVGIVVVGRTALGRDVLVPFDFLGPAEGHDVELRLTRDQYEQLPDFVYNEFKMAPSTWTSVGTARVRQRLGPGQRDVTLETQVLAEDGGIGHVDQVDADPATGQLIAIWVRPERGLRPRMRIPAEWLHGFDVHGNLLVGHQRAEVEAR
jgi:nucleotide-binding universal stress UspA family protein/sporulation protein YlmC with PRC-barrel domain